MEERLDTRTKKDMRKEWYEEGVKAGKNDGWMRLDKDVIKESLDRHPTKDASELLMQAQDGWEETDHFQHYYGSSMGRNPDTNEFDPDQYMEDKEAFWEGFVSSSKEKPIILAQQLVSATARKTKYKAGGKARGKRKSGRAANSMGGTR